MKEKSLTTTTKYQNMHLRNSIDTGKAIVLMDNNQEWKHTRKYYVWMVE